MLQAEPRVGYVLKMYPRFSETFVLRELLAHERAGLALDVFSLRPPVDGVFHEGVAHVRARVEYVERPLKATALWSELHAAATGLPGVWAAVADAADEDPADVFQAARVAQEAHARGIGHLHAHFATAATSVARLAARMAGITYSFTAHAKDIFHESVLEADLRRKLRDAAAVVTVSDYNARHLRERFGADSAGVERVYNGLRLDEFPYASPATRPQRIVAVGRLVEKKGFSVLVQACRVLDERGRAFRCQIVGAGPLEQELRQLVVGLGLGDAVELVGPRAQHELSGYVAGAAALAAPCVVGQDGNADGLPTVLLEAMALGTPCVATDVTGIPELVRDGATGLLVPQHDPVALADALERLLDTPELRVRLAENARAVVEADFDCERTSAQLRALLARAVRPARRVAA